MTAPYRFPLLDRQTITPRLPLPHEERREWWVVLAAMGIAAVGLVIVALVCQ